jgi:FkbM family methyltransferase
MGIARMFKNYSYRCFINILKRGRDFINWDPWSYSSWSQEGEDMVLRRIFESKRDGFYVDIGAHHPKRFSNTYFFYRLGWTGINVDAMPGSMKLFNKWRPRDTNIESGVAQKKGALDYYIFNEAALNGFSTVLSEERSSASNCYYLKDVIKVNVMPLCDILDNHLGGREIDFLTVDVEGLDLDVLQSNDWEKYRPRFVLAEILKSNLCSLNQDPVAKFMKDQGYEVYAKQMNTVFFEDLSSKWSL